MKTNVSGLNDVKFQVKTRLQSMLCIFAFDEMEFHVGYRGRHFVRLDSNLRFCYSQVDIIICKSIMHAYCTAKLQKLEMIALLLHFVFFV